MRRSLVAVLLLFTLIGLSLLSLWLLTPPAPVPASAPATAFSAERAMHHVRQIAQEPHAMGTAAHAEVRKYLLQEMEQLGLSPQVQEATAMESKNGSAHIGYVYNLIGRLKGAGDIGKAVLLMAHYDSQPNARGAGDDGAGVAAILETIRALRQEAPLQHDVIVLLTDGEEYGLYGARAFQKHPWAKDVALVLNLEARGTSGPSMTFEMSPENGWIAKQYARVAPYPFFNSLAYEIYSRMPNNTDFTVFKDEGYTGLNAAFIDGFVHYHKTTDSPENLSLSTLQQHGSNLLALTRHFGRTSLNQTKARDRVFFNVAGSWVINYDASLNLLWVALTTLLLFVTVRVALRQEVVKPRGLLMGFMLYLLLLIVIAIFFYPLNEWVWSQLPLSHRQNGVYSADGFFAAYLLLALGFFLLLSRLALRWLRLVSLQLGVFILQFMLMLTLYLLIPNAAYLFLFPLLFSLSGTLALLLMGWKGTSEMLPKYTLVLLLTNVPAVFLLLPIAQVVFTAFSLQMPYGMVLLALVLAGLLLPLLVFVARGLSWKNMPLLSLVLLLVGGVLLAQAITGEKPSAERPLHSHVSYYLNTDTGNAWWASRFPSTDDWNRQFFTSATREPLREMYPHASIPYLKNEAEALSLPAPVAEVLQDATSDNMRLLRLRLSSPRGAAHLELALQTALPGKVQGIKLAGQVLPLDPLKTDSGEVYFTRFHGLPESKAVVLEVRLAPGAPLTLHLLDQSIGLPQELVKSPRPPHVIAEQGRDSNLTVVRKSYTF
ncbi:M20/M25/M40 family metallo-hydrolase [Pontibacter anaerobius]|uniref:Vacuolar membrane protease n=1 Tax=Pontibacter anaerobius TaxID=2993940 RepID=A0ABT3RIN5_9BACT|nr:M20/M25/M40 family metallo-hydrolase [Pontibacter anaerobius]MCX2741291.1 M20/M25/M40 family metallo-hydrolase [Pontibacter anaerobius]